MLCIKLALLCTVYSHRVMCLHGKQISHSVYALLNFLCSIQLRTSFYILIQLPVFLENNPSDISNCINEQLLRLKESSLESKTYLITELTRINIFKPWVIWILSVLWWSKFYFEVLVFHDDMSNLFWNVRKTTNLQEDVGFWMWPKWRSLSLLPLLILKFYVWSFKPTTT